MGLQQCTFLTVPADLRARLFFFTLLNGMGCMARPLSRGRGLKGVEHLAHFIKACPVPRHTLPHPSMHASSELMHV